VEVVRVDGVEDWLLIHAEVQTQRETEFAERQLVKRVWTVRSMEEFEAQM
jgi:hypothetical protein